MSESGVRAPGLEHQGDAPPGGRAPSIANPRPYPAHKQLDPDSALLSCIPLTGLDAEFLYDTMLLTFSMNSTLKAW
jgi:hypothetical protein